jgi:tetratricopeptide (TPR) repeat protein
MLICTQSIAQKNYFVIPETELRLLPPFCRTGFASYGLSPTDATNHLCPGLYALNDAQRSLGNDAQRNFALQEAVDHLNYTLGHTSPTFPLRSMVLIKRGNAFELQGNRGKAVADYEAAVTTSPKNLLGYLSLCNAYAKLNDKKSALNAAERGLKINPNAKPLQACRNKITGG